VVEGASGRSGVRVAGDAAPGTLVDLDRYPVLDPAGGGYASVVADGRAQLAAWGAAELTGFVHPAGVDRLVADAESLVPRAHPSGGVGTPYLELPDFSLPDDHPRLSWNPYRLSAVPYDVIPRTSPLRRLYEWGPMIELIAAILDRGPLYRYADPFGALNLAVMGDGDELQWHFDQTDFVVSLAVRPAARGGDFEVVPRLRGPGDERYDDVRRVLGGDRSAVRTLPMRPGTLLVFEGRHSLHRVAPVAGDPPRLVGLLAYDTAPGTTGSDLLRMDRYGRTEPFDDPPDQWPTS